MKTEMENAEGKICAGTSRERDSSQCVRVAVNIRPLITAELLVGCTDCISVTPGEPQVQIGSHAFTFDNVYGSTGSPSSAIFDDCVAPLAEALFHGYNATVLAYGQTGSGKTYTMGTNYTGGANADGIIPKVMETIFVKMEKLKDSTEFLIRVSFIEIFKEEVFDLLDTNPPAYLKNEGASLIKSAVPSRVPIHIRETVNGEITLAGVVEAEVRTKEEMASLLARGSLSRATGSTNMNSQSSRSHAIFTITMEQKKTTSCISSAAVNDEIGDDILCAKLHLVDLAGSERAKRTGADGLRFKEGIHINRGLLALGNVISALGDEKKRKEGGHVPYRDSKLTRLLQDSLGGNSKTVMIACVSPADTNAEETLNTLKYANRARNIQNKAIINRDPMAAQMQRMRNQLEQLQAELSCFRGDGAPLEEIRVLRHKILVLEASNAELRQELQERRITCQHLTQRAVDAQVEKDQLIMKIESVRNGKPFDEDDSTENKQNFDLMKNYVSKIQELEGQLLRLQSSNANRNSFIDCLDLEDDGHDLSSVCDGKSIEGSGDVDEIEKELEHSSLQDKLDRELQELDKRLEQKEAEMKRFASVDTSVLKQHYEKKLLDMEQEKKAYQKEIEDLRFKIANISSASDDSAQKLKEDYLQKLTTLEVQVSELKRKQEAQSQLLRQKQKSDEAAKRLHDEIQRIKTQKVQLQHKIKQESEQFRLWKASREKEVLQLKKEGRRNEYEMHKLLALNQRQKMVLQRKTEEASMATKRLKELLEGRRTSSREASGFGNGNGPGIQALMQAIEHELEVTLRVHEVRSEYERQMAARSDMAKEVAKLKEESELLRQKNMSVNLQLMSPGARNSRIFALENMLATSSSTLVSMASQLSEAEERERVFSGRGRWNQVRSLAEAKNLMNHLFNLASSSRCQLRDKEVDCRDKDAEIRELKEKVVRLNSLLRQKDTQLTQKDEQLAEMCRLQKLQKSSIKKFSTANSGIYGANTSSSKEEGHPYDLRKGPRVSQIFHTGGINVDLLEDMDTSESEESNAEYEDHDDDWVESGKRLAKKRGFKPRSDTVSTTTPEESRFTENLNSEIKVEEAVYNVANSESDLCCCSCSRSSSCKTKKCECRAASGKCGASCGCVPSKCSNRDGGVITNGSPEIEMTEDGETNKLLDPVDNENIEKSSMLALHGAMLLESAMMGTPVGVNEDGTTRRKPLSDIGNTVIKPHVPRPNQRKKWRKQEILLVPTAPPPSSQQDGSEVPRPTNDVVEAEIPLKLPRAMRSTTANINPLRERNADTVDESRGDKEEASVVAPRSPVQRVTDFDEKENNRV